MEQNRRVFLGTAASVAAGAATFFPASRLNAQSTADPLGKAIDRELVAGLRLMTKNQTGEGPRRVASLLRLAALHHTAEDAKLKAALRANIRKVGREAVLQEVLDPTELEANMRQWGFTFPIPVRNPSRETREKVLAELLAHGITRTWRATADAFDTQSVELDRVAGAIKPVRIDTACVTMTITLDSLVVTAGMACAFGAVPLCLAATISVGAQVAQMRYWGC